MLWIKFFLFIFHQINFHKENDVHCAGSILKVYSWILCVREQGL